MREGFEAETYLDLDNKILHIKKGSSQYTYTLVPTTKSDLASLREADIPSFVLKIDGKLFWAEIDRNISFFAKPLFGKHLCATGRQICQRLLIPMNQPGHCMKTYNNSKRIENYPGIIKGYETFGTRYDCFVVCECKYFKA